MRKQRRTVGILAVLALSALFPSDARGHHGCGIVVDHDRHRVYFLDTYRNAVWSIHGDGRLERFGPGVHASTLSLDPLGNLYVDSFSTRLLRVAPDGAVTLLLGEPEGPVRPSLERGARVGDWSTFLAVDREGNLYFRTGNDFEDGRDVRILRVSGEGQATTLAGDHSGHADGPGRAARFKAPFAAAWGPDGALVLTDDDAIRKVTPEGIVSTLARQTGSRPGGVEAAVPFQAPPGDRRGHGRECLRSRLRESARRPGHSGRSGHHGLPLTPVLVSQRSRGGGRAARSLHPRGRSLRGHCGKGAPRPEGLGRWKRDDGRDRARSHRDELGLPDEEHAGTGRRRASLRSAPVDRAEEETVDIAVTE